MHLKSVVAGFVTTARSDKARSNVVRAVAIDVAIHALASRGNTEDAH